MYTIRKCAQRIEIFQLQSVLIWNCDHASSLKTRKRAGDGFHRQTEIISNVLAVHRDADDRATRFHAIGKEQQESRNTFLGRLAAHYSEMVLDIADALGKNLKQPAAQAWIVPAKTFNPLLRK